MEIIIIVFISGSIGSLLAVSPLRDKTYSGALIVPTVTVLVATWLWTAMLWAGIPAETAIMWTLPAVIGGIAGVVTAALQKSMRAAYAQRRRDELVRG